MLKVDTYTVDWEQEVVRLIEEGKTDPDAIEVLLDYIVELTQEAYLRGRAS